MQHLADRKLRFGKRRVSSVNSRDENSDRAGIWEFLEMLLTSIIVANLISRLSAVGLALYLSFRLLSRWGNVVTSIAAGLLLTIACTHLIPEALHEGVDAASAGVVLLIALLGFILLDCILERYAGHSHGTVVVRRDAALVGGKPRVVEQGCGCCASYAGDSSPRAAVLLIGMACHNFVDGVLVAAAFMADYTSGWIVTAAIFAHEIPQLMGQLVILIQGGMSRKSAGWLTALVAMAAVIGGVFGWALFTEVHGIVGYAMLVSAASFVFVVLSVLLPELIHSCQDMASSKMRFPVKEIAGLLAGVLLSLLILMPMHEKTHSMVHEESDHVQMHNDRNDGH